MSSILSRLRSEATGSSKYILLPETNDPRVVDAANLMQSSGIAQPLIITRTAWIDHNIPVLTEKFDHSELINQASHQLFNLRQEKGETLESAYQAVANNPILFSAILVKLGYAYGAVSGSIATTAEVLRAGIQGIGLAKDTKLVSSFFLMDMPDGRVFSFADCAVVPDPDAVQLAEIAITTARNHEKLTGTTAHVAMLSFSTNGSANHPKISKVRQAVILAKQRAPELSIDGEMQFDSALLPSIGAIKAPGSTVAGRANVFVFPDLDSGNIAYKITERLGNAAAIGPILQGLALPWMDLSRGCKATDIVDVAAIASLL